MNKVRLENFSDGVFAIAVTLLILSVKIPDSKNYDNHELNYALRKALPHLVTFAFSFMVVGVFWVAHHRIFAMAKKVDNALLWLNIFYLLFVAIMPYPTALLAENPFLTTGILVYSTALFIIAFMHFLLINHIYVNKRIRSEVFAGEIYRSYLRIGAVGPVCYILAAGGCFISPYVSFFFIFAALIFYIFFSRSTKVEEKLLMKSE